ncbi:MAG: protein TolA [Gammaproteobacteria bacterium]|nr:protein TolA [Gammaproteobacteria bacterium]
MKTSVERFAVGALCGFASLLLHALLFVATWFGAPHHRNHVPNAQGAAAGAAAVTDESSMTLVFIDDTHASDKLGKRAYDITSLVINPEVLSKQTADEKSYTPAAAARLNDTPDDKADDKVSIAEANGDQSGHAVLFGRYMGQITARIERAWLRPRTSPGTGSFACRVRIDQARNGSVREITLESCNGDVRWQASLVHAIQSASPLPAPPDPVVFSPVLTIDMDADPYVAGGSGEGFEPATPVAMSAASAEASTAINRIVETLRSHSNAQSGSIALTIIGSPRPSDTPAEEERTSLEAQSGVSSNDTVDSTPNLEPDH